MKIKINIDSITEQKAFTHGIKKNYLISSVTTRMQAALSPHG